VFGTLGTVEYVEDKNGNQKEVVRKYTGVVGNRQVYSDLLLMFLAKGLRPNKWRENVKVDVAHTGTVQINDTSRERLADKLLAAIERKQLATSNPGPNTLNGSSVREREPLEAAVLPVIDVEPVTSVVSDAPNDAEDE
jgi:hypothetical protein